MQNTEILYSSSWFLSYCLGRSQKQRGIAHSPENGKLVALPFSHVIGLNLTTGTLTHVLIKLAVDYQSLLVVTGN